MRRNPPVGPGDVEVVGNNVFDERAAARAALDIDREGLGAGELAMLDADVANAAGSLAADADAGEDGIREGAIGDEDVLGGLEQRSSLRCRGRT